MQRNCISILSLKNTKEMVLKPGADRLTLTQIHVISEIVTFVKWTKRMNELLCTCISYLCPVNHA